MSETETTTRASRKTRDGVVTSGNALTLMRLSGLDVPAIENASDFAQADPS